MKKLFLLGFVVLSFGFNLQAEPTTTGDLEMSIEEYYLEEMEATQKPTPHVTKNNCVTDIVDLPRGTYCIQIGDRIIWFEIKSEDLGPQFYPSGNPRFEPRF